ncbi:MAG: DUF2155 domain-containing protein [Gemmobacter sp.]
MSRAAACLLAAALALSPLAVPAQEVRAASGGVLRWLDTVSGVAVDIELSRGESAARGRLTMQLDECRYPVDNPSADAFAHVTIRDRLVPDAPVFSGWMIASSPALSALDHPRYDVWLIRCIIEE